MISFKQTLVRDRRSNWVRWGLDCVQTRVTPRQPPTVVVVLQLSAPTLSFSFGLFLYWYRPSAMDRRFGGMCLMNSLNHCTDLFQAFFRWEVTIYWRLEVFNHCCILSKSSRDSKQELLCGENINKNINITIIRSFSTSLIPIKQSIEQSIIH